MHFALPSTVRAAAFAHAILLSQHEMHLIQAYLTAKTFALERYMPLWKEVGLLPGETVDQVVFHQEFATIKTLFETKEYLLTITNKPDKKMKHKDISGKKIVGSEGSRRGMITLADSKTRTPLYSIAKVVYVTAISTTETKLYASVYPINQVAKKGKTDSTPDSSKVIHSQVMSNYRTVLIFCFVSPKQSS